MEVEFAQHPERAPSSGQIISYYELPFPRAETIGELSRIGGLHLAAYPNRRETLSVLLALNDPNSRDGERCKTPLH